MAIKGEDFKWVANQSVYSLFRPPWSRVDPESQAFQRSFWILLATQVDEMSSKSSSLTSKSFKILTAVGLAVTWSR